MLNPQDIIGILEDFLVDAKRGDLHHVAVSGVFANGSTRNGFVGTIPKDVAALGSVLSMADQIKKRIADWTLPEQDSSLGADYACWHCGQNPAGFDFIVWLVLQEMLRVVGGAPAPLKIGFWHGSDQSNLNWTNNVYRPALAFIGAIEDNTAFKRQGHAYFLTAPIVEMHRAGIKVPVFKPAHQWQLPRDVITITLRETNYQPHRNSNVNAWVRFARTLKRHGENVIFVRDTAKADRPISGFDTCGIASKNLDARMWLYDNAKLNCFVSNGPWSLAQFSDKPLLCFVPPEKENSDYKINRPSFWKEKMGISHGGQYPWHGSRQRIVWERDDYANIIRAYDALK